MSQENKSPANHGKQWTDFDFARLSEGIKGRLSLEILSRSLGRKSGAIQSKLKDMIEDLIDLGCPDDYILQISGITSEALSDRKIGRNKFHAEEYLAGFKNKLFHSVNHKFQPIYEAAMKYFSLHPEIVHDSTIAKIIQNLPEFKRANWIDSLNINLRQKNEDNDEKDLGENDEDEEGIQ
jgi:hypothetical protein